MDQDAGIIAYKNAIKSPAVGLTKPIDYTNVKNKTALITGGASGLGAGFAAQLAANGANVIIGDINEAKGTEFVAKLRMSSGSNSHHFVRVNVTDWKSQVSMFKEAARLSPHRGVDIVIANAGINDPSEAEVFELNIPNYVDLSDPPPPKLKTLQIDLEGLMYTTTLALSYLSNNPGSKSCSEPEQTRDRHLILVSSMAGVVALPASSIYCAAKHGVVGLFRSLRLSAPILHGVRVNMINPYYVDTPILDIRGHMPLLGVAMTKIEDVAEAVMRLCTDQSIIGRALLIGTESSVEQVRAAGLEDTMGKHAGGAIWDIYGHDFEQTDLLMRRTISLLNMVSSVRGWVGILQDIWMRLTMGIARLLHLV